MSMCSHVAMHTRTARLVEDRRGRRARAAMSMALINALLLPLSHVSQSADWLIHPPTTATALTTTGPENSP